MEVPKKPIVIPRAHHCISRNAINRNALKVLYRLHEAGFSALLVGGCVRDLLLGFKPKDFDVATDASPEEVRQLFRNCRLIGKRFRLAHILFGKDIIEVATFRTHHENAHEQHGKTHQGMIVRDNVYGTITDDAFRRDFRMNALYYNIADFSIIDYTGGMQDIENRVLHIIGDPEKRFQEDPVRLLRAIRLMAKLNLTIQRETEDPLRNLSYLLQKVSPGRLFQEIIKIFQGGAAFQTITLLQKYKLFEILFPSTPDSPAALALLQLALSNSDQRVGANKTVLPAFLFAAILWHPIKIQAKKGEENGLPPFVAFDKALHHVIKQQTTQLAIPRITQMSIREICGLQYRFPYRRGSQPLRLLEHPRFRAGYDLLLLRTQSGEIGEELAAWWTKFYEVNLEEREKMLKELQKQGPKVRRVSKRKKRVIKE